MQHKHHQIISTHSTPLRLVLTTQEPGILAAVVENRADLPEDKSQYADGQNSSDDSDDHACLDIAKSASWIRFH